MLALVLGIVAVVGWIIFDVAVSLATAPMLPVWEWRAFVFGGASLIVLTVLAAICEYLGRAKEVADLKSQISSGQKTHSGEHDLLAKGIVRLGEMVNAEPHQSLDRIAVAAITKIQTLEARIDELRTSQTDLTTMFWRRFTDRERQIFKDLLVNIGRYVVRICHAPQTDCRELAQDLRAIFRSVDWDVDYGQFRLDGQSGSWEPPAGAAGIHVEGKYTDPKQLGSQVMNALRPFIGGGIGYVAALEGQDPADVVIIIGPKMARSSQQ